MDTSNLTWRKAKASGGNGGNCVEVAGLPDGDTAVRNSRFPDGPVLKFTRAEWEAFLLGCKDGEFS